MSRPTEVLVKVKDLEEIQQTYRNTVTGGMGIAYADAAFRRLFDAIPEPEWEPSEEQINAVLKAFFPTYVLRTDRPWAIERLKNLHAAGLVLP